MIWKSQGLKLKHYSLKGGTDKAKQKNLKENSSNKSTCILATIRLDRNSGSKKKTLKKQMEKEYRPWSTSQQG